MGSPRSTAQAVTEFIGAGSWGWLLEAVIVRELGAEEL
jgi:hypothetical protein